MAETNEYDVIFTALKHPVRRQILLLLEERGEVSFSEIQNVVSINDTGLMSYHLKELAPLIEQSARGKYRLSGIGQTSVTLFRKVESEKERLDTAIRSELEKLVGEIIFVFFIVVITLIAPLSVDIYVSVQSLMRTDFSFELGAVMYLASISGMILGVILFTFYDRHYFSKKMRTNVIHSTIFATCTSLLSVISVLATHQFELSFLSNASPVLLIGIFSVVSFLVSAPFITYSIIKLVKKF